MKVAEDRSQVGKCHRRTEYIHPAPPPPHPHTAADTQLVTTYAGSPETPDTVWPVSRLILMNLKILKIYTTWVQEKHLKTVVKRQENP